MIKYEVKHEGGYPVECDSCGSVAPTYTQKIHCPDRTRELCEVCASSFIGNATRYPDQYVNVQLYQSLAQVANLILDKIGRES